MRPERYIELLIDMPQVRTKRHAPVPCKAPTEPALPRMATDQTSHARRHDQRLEHDRPGGTAQGLMEELEDGDEGGGAEQGLEIGNGEEDGYAEGPGGKEADKDGAEDGDGDGAGGVGDFFGEVGGAVEAGEGVVGVDEAYDECFSIFS